CMTQLAAVLNVNIELFGANADGYLFRRTQSILDSTAWTPWVEFGGNVRPATLPHTAPVPTVEGLRSQTGDPVDRTLTLYGGGTPPSSWSVTTLPPGLPADSAGRITGTIGRAGLWGVNVTVTDFNNVAVSYVFVWWVTLRLEDRTAQTHRPPAAGGP